MKNAKYAESEKRFSQELTNKCLRELGGIQLRLQNGDDVCRVGPGFFPVMARFLGPADVVIAVKTKLRV